MKAKLIFLSLSCLGLMSFTGLTQADEYYSSQTPGNGYYSSGSSNEQKPSHHEEHKKKELFRKGDISISVNMPNFDNGPAEDNTYVPNRPHHRGRPQWIEMMRGEPLPEGAVVGGGEAEGALIVCRANYRGGVHPGKLVGDSCNISWGGREVVMSRYEVLVSYAPLNWVPASYGQIPAGAIRGGYEDGRPLFICQARYNGGMHPGKIIGDNCNIGWGGAEISIPEYNVLVR